MVEIEQVAEFAARLPEVTESDRRGNPVWTVGARTFAWMRSFTKADLRRFADAPVPQGPILAVRVPAGEKEEVLATHAEAGFFTIPHFVGYDAVLIQLAASTPSAVQEALLDAWLTCAPKALIDRHVPPTR